ncbi:MAG: hypothetical protein ABFD64_09790 [Armatimonadota bacterium]
MIIHVSELAKISEKLIAHLREVAGEVIDVPVDCYWNIPKAQKYNAYQEPSELDMGQLSDDWNELQKVLEKHFEPLTHDFVPLAAILRALGEHTLL